jgi:hypothetical protein
MVWEKLPVPATKQGKLSKDKKALKDKGSLEHRIG